MPKPYMEINKYLLAEQQRQSEMGRSRAANSTACGQPLQPYNLGSLLNASHDSGLAQRSSLKNI